MAKFRIEGRAAKCRLPGDWGAAGDRRVGRWAQWAGRAQTGALSDETRAIIGSR